MGQILHGSARTTEVTRRAIQNSEESLKSLSEKYAINQKTIVKWRKRNFVHDAPMGRQKSPHQRFLQPKKRPCAWLFASIRRFLWMIAYMPCKPRDPASVPFKLAPLLSTSRHQSDVEGDKPAKKKFKKYPVGYFHIDITEVRTEEGKPYLFVGIDRTSKFTYVELHERQTKMIAVEFLRKLVAAVPYKINTILTDNGIQFTNCKKDKYAFIKNHRSRVS